MGRLVKHAKLHDAVFVVGLGQLDKTIDVNEGRYKGAILEHVPEDQAVYFTMNGHEAFIPCSMFICATYFNENEVKSKVKSIRTKALPTQ